MCKFIEGDFEISFDRRDLFEILQLILFATLIIFLRWLLLPSLIKEKEIPINGLTAGFLIGTIHFFANNLLSKLYNLERIMCPFKFIPIITPKSVRMIGIIILLFVFMDIIRLLL